jgi:hypothetical protein
VCRRSALDFRASPLLRLNMFSIPTLIPPSRPRPTDSRTSPSTPGRTRSSKRTPRLWSRARTMRSQLAPAATHAVPAETRLHSGHF